MSSDGAMPSRKRGRDPVTDASLCGHYDDHRNNDGELCGARVRKGTTSCDRHAGVPKEVHKAKGAIALEIRHLRLEDLPPVQPRAMILRMVAASAYLVGVYWEDLQKALAEEDGEVDKALTGHVYSVNPETGVATKTGEYIRMRQKRFDDERDRLVRYSAAAVAAKASEDLVDMYKQVGDTSAQLVLAVARDLGLPVDSADVRKLMVFHLQRLAPGMPVIEGSVAA